jgi:hypothetical protein
VIGKVSVPRGEQVEPLIWYLYGPGRANEHTDPHIVAAWHDPAGLEPPLRPGGGRDFRRLTGLLRQPHDALGDRGHDRPVWHCSVRAAPGDRTLSDDEWADVAADVMARTGLAPRGQEHDAVRWVAIRHADDHVHIVALLARQDGGKAFAWRDFFQVADACHAAEQRYGLTPAPPCDRTAARRPTRAEDEKASRQRRAEAPRVTLRRHAATAAAAADAEEEYFALLEQAGVLVRLRHSTRDPGQVTGYAIALPGDTGRDGQPVWYGGGKLAADLTLPKLRARWDPARTGPGPRPGPVGPDAALDHAARAAAAASDQLRAGPGPDAGDIAWAAADVLRAAAAVLGSPALRLAADAYDRAARAPWGRLPPPSPAGIQLRAAARMVAATAHVTRDRPLAHIAFLIRMIALLEAVAELRQAQQRLAQAGAAQAAARQLRDATARPGPGGPPQAPRPDHDPSVRLAAADFPAGPVTRPPPRQAPGPARPGRPPRPAPRRPPGPSP